MTLIVIKDNEMIKMILTLTPQWMGTAATQRALEGRLLLVNLLCKVVSMMIMIMIFDDHAYLIFVIFFTQSIFLENKIYTEKRQFYALNL